MSNTLSKLNQKYLSETILPSSNLLSRIKDQEAKMKNDMARDNEIDFD